MSSVITLIRAIFGAAILGFFCLNGEAATFTVTNSDNDGAGSLRQAVNDANSTAGNDSIVFDAGVFSISRTIALSGGTLLVNDNGSLTISGAGVSMPTIYGNTFQILRLEGSANLTLFNLKLTEGGNNAGNCGGAIDNTSGTVLLTSVIISQSRAADFGGAICNRSGGTVTINRSTIADNFTTGSREILGGGAGIYNDGVLNVNDSLFLNNQSIAFSNIGGGIYNDSGTATITNSTFANNSASTGGGAVGNRSGRVNLIGSTIAFNTSGVRNGIGMVNARNTIISNNGAGDFSGALVSQGYNLIGNPNNLTISGNLTGNLISVDARLAPLADNGGTSQTFALLSNSPAINAGGTAFAVDAAGVPLRFDQRGACFRRIVGAAVDIGAFEFQTTTANLANGCPAQFDFDGDSKSDYAVFRPITGFWYLQQSQAGVAFNQVGSLIDKLAPADYDGDGETDLAVFRPSNGVWLLLRSTQGLSAFEFGQVGDAPVPADYDGDGRADLAVFRDGVWSIRQSSNNQIRTVQFGAANDQTVPADYDGDGKADVAVYRNGTWSWLRSFDNIRRDVQFGIASDKPVPADYDGDGRTDQAVYRDGIWYWFGSTQGLFGVAFGLPDDRPVAADYDGDGRADTAVWRPSNGTFYLLRSSNNLFTGFQFGVSDDLPIAAAYVP